MEWNRAVRELTAEAWEDRALLDVRGVQYDSRRVGLGDVFVAMRGETSDGNRFVDRALAQGTAAIVTDSAEVYAALRSTTPSAGLALVRHGRRALAEISAAIFGHPEQRLKLSAVTGTNGKTTTAWVLEQMLREAGRRCCLVGTIETHIADALLPSPHTTPESRDLLATFSDAVGAGCTEAVIEASSHALAQERLWKIPVDVAIWTNLTQDHLDFHGSMARYFAAKARLFRGLGAPPPRVAVINRDDAYGARIAAEAREAGSAVWTYGIETRADTAPDFTAENVQLRAGETSFDLQTPGGVLSDALAFDWPR